MAENILELTGISKEFPGVKALSDVDISIKQGDIHAVVGENGAGKSTLMKILSGVYPIGTYEGTVKFLGEERQFSGIRDSEEAGIAIIYQELALVKGMSIAENVFLGNEIRKKSGVIDWNLTMQKTTSYLNEVGLDINPVTPVIKLGVGQQQLVEIAKALSKNAKLLILDEPTAALTEAEADNLLGIMKKLKERGVTCVFITHKLDEVFRIADVVTVLRDGRSISTDPIGMISKDIMISRMVGRDMTEYFPHVDHEVGDEIFRLENWTVNDPELVGRKLVDDVSFSLNRGEILGVAGLMGSGRTELAMSVFGCYRGYTSGRMFLEGREVEVKEPRDAIMLGISYLSEDRKKYGLNMLMDIEDNVTIAALDKISRGGIIDANKKNVSANEYIENLNIRTPSSRQMVANLSGGNQQKVVLGKWLMTEPNILILDEPTRGIDVGAKYEIYSIMNKLIEQGVSIIMISSELPEVLGMSDRIIVMHEGRITGILLNQELTQEIVMTYATGEH